MKITNTTTHLSTLEELGRRLALARKQQGYTQVQLAKEAGLGVVTIIRIESGQDAQFSSWIKIFNVLEKTPVIDALLPEQILSPMAEVQKKRRRGDPTTQGPHVWGDGKS